MTAASRELNVTPGAVSRQITGLEALIGHTLLTRTRQGISVNARGERLHAALLGAFQALAEAVEEAARAEDQPVLTLNLYPTFAIQWLMPRLEALYAHVPNASFRIHTSLKGGDFSRGGADIGIEIAGAPRPGLHMRLLFGRQFTPVCSPALLAQYGGDPSRALRRSHILYSDLHVDKWDKWSGMSGAAIDADRRIRFDNSTLAYQAAREGAGFAIGQPVLLRGDLSGGRLTAPFPQRLTGKRSYYVACREDRKDDPLIRSVMDWIVQQSEARSRSAPTCA